MNELEEAQSKIEQYKAIIRQYRQRDHEQRREVMARAVSFAMLGTEDRWQDWLTKADELLYGFATQLGIAGQEIKDE